MSLLGKIVGSDIGGLAEKLVGLIDKFVETPDEKKAAEIIKIKLLSKPDELQMEVNKIEAAHRTLFVAGWRPAVGWVCVAALAWSWIVQPIVSIAVSALGVNVELPDINIDDSMTLIMALLGMGALRTFEKTRG